jgi:hypothetical protein
MALNRIKIGIGLFALLLCFQKGIASEFVVYNVYRGLYLGGKEEVPQKDFYLNMGSVHGVKTGSMVQVSRRKATYDLSSQQLYRDVLFPIALVKVIHVESMSSIARLEKALPADQTPTMTPNSIMVGDLVKLVTP